MSNQEAKKRVASTRRASFADAALRGLRRLRLQRRCRWVQMTLLHPLSPHPQKKRTARLRSRLCLRPEHPGAGTLPVLHHLQPPNHRGLCVHPLESRLSVVSSTPQTQKGSDAPQPGPAEEDMDYVLCRPMPYDYALCRPPVQMQLPSRKTLRKKNRYRGSRHLK